MKLTEEQKGELREQIEQEKAALKAFLEGANREASARSGRITALEELLEEGDEQV